MEQSLSSSGVWTSIKASMHVHTRMQTYTHTHTPLTYTMHTPKRKNYKCLFYHWKYTKQSFFLLTAVREGHSWYIFSQFITSYMSNLQRECSHHPSEPITMLEHMCVYTAMDTQVYAPLSGAAGRWQPNHSFPHKYLAIYITRKIILENRATFPMQYHPKWLLISNTEHAINPESESPVCQGLRSAVAKSQPSLMPQTLVPNPSRVQGPFMLAVHNFLVQKPSL